jgi:hypothetical protein
MPAGRPTIYNEELADLICLRIATHQMGTRKLCQKYDDMPDDTCIYEWRHKYVEFAHKYAQAKMQQAEIMAEEILDIADDDSQDVRHDKDGNEICNSEFVARSRLRVDTRKWLASKLAPKIYGDKQQIVTTIKHEENIQDLD